MSPMSHVRGSTCHMSPMSHVPGSGCHMSPMSHVPGSTCHISHITCPRKYMSHVTYVPCPGKYMSYVTYVPCPRKYMSHVTYVPCPRKYGCSTDSCYTSKDRGEQLSTFDAVVFHERSLDKDDLPEQRLVGLACLPGCLSPYLSSCLIFHIHFNLKKKKKT